MATTRTWKGGGNNNASNPRDWNPMGVPQPGDNLSMTQGVMNVSGNALTGDTLSVSNADINTHAAARLHLSVTNTVNVHNDGTVFLTDLIERGQHLNISGGTINIIGTSTFDGNGGSTGSAVFDSDLVGSGTLDLLGGNHNGIAMEIDGSVARGLTFRLGSAAPTASLQIDDPTKFPGLIDLSQSGTADLGGGPQSLFDFAAFMGLRHVTSASLHDDTLRMFDGKKLVDTVRLTGGSGLQLQQNSEGVVLSSGFESVRFAPGGIGTMIPFHIS
jgi:hypothetical protein